MILFITISKDIFMMIAYLLCSRWMAYSRKHMEYTFSYELLMRFLESLDQKWTPDSLSREEVSHALYFIEYWSDYNDSDVFVWPIAWCKVSKLS